MHSTIRSFVFLILIILSQNAISQYIPFCQKGNWGFANKEGKIIIPCIYQEVDFYSDDDLAKTKKLGKYGYINENGQIVIPFEYENCMRIYEVFHSDYSIGIKDNPTLYLNRDFDYDDVKNNLYVVSKNKKHGVLILKEGKPTILIPLIYSKIQFDPNKKIFHCSTSTGILYFNKAGFRLTREQVNNIDRIETMSLRDDGINKPEVIKSKDKVGVVECFDRSLKPHCDTLVPLIYDNVITENYGKEYYYNSNVFGVRLGEKWGFVDNKKNLLLPIQFDSINLELSKDFRIRATYQRLFVVMKDGEWGILGKQDDNSDSFTTVLPFEYEAVSKIYYSYLLVKKENKFQIFSIETYSLINQKSYTAINKYRYESVNDFQLFQVSNRLGQTVYLGENGVEFFTD